MTALECWSAVSVFSLCSLLPGGTWHLCARIQEKVNAETLRCSPYPFIFLSIDKHMPIYEFFCDQCHTIFNFFSRRPNSDKRPICPQCGKCELVKMMSTFATIGKARETDEDDPLAGLDESKMEQALAGLMQEAERVNEDDPRQMANLMRKFADKTGMSLGAPMEEAIARMEAGEDPEQIEREMGDLMESEEPFTLEGLKKKAQSRQRSPRRDDHLYEL